MLGFGLVWVGGLCVVFLISCIVMLVSWLYCLFCFCVLLPVLLGLMFTIGFVFLCGCYLGLGISGLLFVWCLPCCFCCLCS